MNMHLFDPDLLCQALSDSPYAKMQQDFTQAVKDALTDVHGDTQKWQDVLANLPTIDTRHIDLQQEQIKIGQSNEINDAQRQQLRDLLMQLKPWRKGPFELFGIDIDSEWRCDFKWNRVIKHISSLTGKRVLDVGGGNGYYALRMLGAGAKHVLCIDPMRLFYAQFKALTHYFNPACTMLPLRMEQMPIAALIAHQLHFDSVFSMGVLYHRREPLTHLKELYRVLKPGGELVLETLIIDADKSCELELNGGRYAKMGNVHYIPSVARLIDDMGKCDFHNIRVVDCAATSLQEQRVTQWIGNQSLADFLDPLDQNKTIEGHPAPIRAVVIAQK